MSFRMKLGMCPRSIAGQLLNKILYTQNLDLLRIQEYRPSTAKWRPLSDSLQSTVTNLSAVVLDDERKGREN